MADYPALPLWTDAYLADTRHLTTLQHGAYVLLLMEAWRRPACSLPDDDTLLSRLSGLDPKTWADNRAPIMAFWKLDHRTKTFVQKRLSKEKAYVKKRSKTQRDKAVKRWKKTEKPDAAASAGTMPQGSPEDAPTPTPTPTPTAKDKSLARGAASRGSRLPANWTLPRDWRDWAATDRGWPETAIAAEAAKFADYWHGKVGKDAVKADWLATWRNWCRRADEPRGGGGGRGDEGYSIGGTRMNSPC